MVVLCVLDAPDGSVVVVVLCVVVPPLRSGVVVVVVVWVDPSGAVVVVLELPGGGSTGGGVVVVVVVVVLPSEFTVELVVLCACAAVKARPIATIAALPSAIPRLCFLFMSSSLRSRNPTGTAPTRFAVAGSLAEAGGERTSGSTTHSTHPAAGLCRPWWHVWCGQQLLGC